MSLDVNTILIQEIRLLKVTSKVRLKYESIN